MFAYEMENGILVYFAVLCNIPFIHGCIVQRYQTVPRFTIAEPDESTFMIPVSNKPSVAVAVCGAMSFGGQLLRELRNNVSLFSIMVMKNSRTFAIDDCHPVFSDVQKDQFIS
jgi:hypothetical protein